MPDSGFAHVYEVKLVGTINSQECLNIFFYGAADELLDTSAWLNEFDTAVVATLLPCVSDSYVATLLQIQEVKGGSQFDSKTVNEFGAISGDSLPPYCSWDFTYIRGGALERNGYKRFGGVPESRQANGIATSAALTALAALAAALEVAVGTVPAGTITPVIQREFIHKVAQVPPKYFTISSVVYSKIGSQNSRKYGHGR